MKFLQRNCREVTALVLAGEDRTLGPVERWIVRAHLKACHACPRFARQVALVREALPRWRAYRESGESND
jgi:predicted anti-sigma-YlaC factor YlaD